jgi:post-segregation antitoxin (ccd killing protein)
MATTKISITIDTDRLEDLKRLSANGASLSAVISEAVSRELKRLQLLALLEEWERESPISPEGRAEGELLWQRIKSSWTREPSAPLPKKTKRSASRSKKP